MRNNSGGVEESHNISQTLTTVFHRAADISETFFWIMKNRNISQRYYNRRREQHTYTHIHTYIHKYTHTYIHIYIHINTYTS